MTSSGLKAAMVIVVNPGLNLCGLGVTELDDYHGLGLMPDVPSGATIHMHPGSDKWITG